MNLHDYEPFLPVVLDWIDRTVLLQIAECRREALISHSETYAGTPKIEWMN